ncbi:MAG: 4-hydroxybenzoate octaprenyltransferase [Arenimonas sp.]
MNSPAAGVDWHARLSPYWRLIRGDRPVGTLLLLWPTAWALWLAAGGIPPLATLAIFLAGVWLTRSAGCAVNDYADRWLDPQVARTRSRPLATGELEPRAALWLFVLMMAVAFGLVLLTNRLTIYLSVVGLVLAASYPFLKRHTYLPQLYLGLAFGWGIPMAFAAVQGKVPETAWLLFLGNLLWTTGYDTWYAMVDREDDLRAGAKSTAILFGDLDLFALGVLYSGFLMTMLLLGFRAGLGINYLAGLTVAAGFIAWQFAVGRDRRPENCQRAFQGNQWVGLVVFLGIALDLAAL